MSRDMATVVREAWALILSGHLDYTLPSDYRFIPVDVFRNIVQ